MRARILSATVLVPAAIALVLAGGVALTIAVAVMAALAAWEAFAILSAAAAVPATNELRAAVSLGCAVPVLTIAVRESALGPVAGICLLSSLAVLLLSGAPAKHSVLWSAAIATAAYVDGLAVHMPLLREGHDGLAWVVAACAVTWITDTGAFFTGRAFGRRPFFQSISPKKTLEGAVGGLVAGTAAGTLVGLIAGIASPPICVAIALSGSVAGQAGDLLESLFKREAGVKDSGTLIPGHGGVLDRIDSLLVVVAVLFYWRLCGA